MKKTFAWILTLVMLCMCLGACGEEPVETLDISGETQEPTEEVKMNISNSDMFTPTELYEATWTVSRYFTADHPQCVLKEVEYDEEYSSSRRPALKEQYEATDIIVILATFTTGSEAMEGFQPNTSYEDVEVILVLGEDGRTWLVKDLGQPRIP